jgi:competence protein ComGC
MKRGFTLIDLLAIISTFVLLLIPAFFAVRHSAQVQNQIEADAANHGVFRCIKSFETNRTEYRSILKVSLKSVDSSKAYVFICKTDDIFAQFEDNKYYEVGWIEVDTIKYAISAEEIMSPNPERN